MLRYIAIPPPSLHVCGARHFVVQRAWFGGYTTSLEAQVAEDVSPYSPLVVGGHQEGRDRRTENSFPSDILNYLNIQIGL